MKIQRLLQDYESGRINETSLVLGILCFVTDENIASTMQMLPAEILLKIRDFCGRYFPSMKIFNAPRPSDDAVRLVIDWFAHNKAAYAIRPKNSADEHDGR